MSHCSGFARPISISPSARLEAAGVGFRRAVELDPGLVPARVGLAQVHMSEGDQDSARRELIVALEFDPENTQATALLERIAAP